MARDKTGAGVLVLINTNTYTGQTQINGGTLQLGSGLAGQDGSLASTSIANNALLIVSNAGPTTFAGPITGGGGLWKYSPATLTLSGANQFGSIYLRNSGTITGGTISLPTSTEMFRDLAAGLSTLASPLNITSGGGPAYLIVNAGTLDIAASVFNNQSHYYLSGNISLDSPGSITETGGGGLVLNHNTQPSSFQQNSGVISCDRANANAVYLNQGGNADGSSYTISGGSLLLTGAGSTLCIGYGAGSGAIMTINGPSAVVQARSVNLNGNTSACNGAVNLQNGLLQTDRIYQANPSNITVNLSGGTLQPFSAGVASNGWGSSTSANNISLNVSGTGATMSSSDASGTGQTVPLYANLTGSGTLSTAGAGTLVVYGNNSGFTGLMNILSGTVQIGSGSVMALGNSGGSGVRVSGAVLDINGDSSANPGPVTLVSGSIIDSLGYGALNATGYTLQSGTVSAVLGGSSAPLNKTTSGLAVLNAANTYGGGTTVSGGTLALGSGTATLGNGGGNVTVSPGAMLDVSAWEPGGYNFNNMTLVAGRTGSAATDIQGSLNLTNATIRPAAGGTMTISGSLALNGNVTYSYAPGSQIAVGGALSLSYPEYLLPTAALASGTYTLMTYNAGTPDPLTDFSMAGSYQSGTRQTYTFGTSGGSAVTLSVVGAAANLEWNAANGTWDVNSASSWYNTGTHAVDVFYNADNVTFNDRPGGSSGTANLAASVEPASMTVSNTAVAYTIAGFGSIDGTTSLVKNGPGALTINTYNNYSGGTFLNAGRLNLGDYLALGSGALTIGGGSLDNTSGGPLTLSNTQNWNASFVFVGSNPLTVGPVTLGTTPTVTVSSGTLTAGSSISGGYGLTLAGPGMLVLGAASNYTGDTTISRGVLQIGAAGAVPNGAGAGNVVFSSAAKSAVLDLNGNDATINGLSQPAPSTANVVLDNATGAFNTLYVGNNNSSSVFGGVLADNNNGGGSQLNLHKIGAGVLTLIGSSTYSGATTVNGGTLQLGDGSAGHDGSINQTSGIANSGILAFDYFAPQTVAPTITGTGTIAQLGAGGVAFAGGATANFLSIAGNGTIGGTVNLNAANGGGFYVGLANTATGTTTLAAAVNMQNGREDWTGGSGTLNIEGPITQSSGHFFIDNGNYTLGSSGSITVNNYALVIGSNTTTNFNQTGGLVSTSRAGVALYFTQGGVSNYLLTGGTVSSNNAVLGYGLATNANLTINGPAAVASLSSFNLNDKGSGNNFPGGLGTVNLENGSLAVDDLYTFWPTGVGAGGSAFNFSGGTLEPLDGSAKEFGSTNAGNNFDITLSGSGAVISSSDLSGNPQTVPVYASLKGSGGVTFTGAGKLILVGTTGNSVATPTNSNYSGGSFVTGSGTVQLGAATALGTGALAVKSGVVDLAGFSPTIGGLSGAAGALIANLSGATSSALTVNPSSGASNTYAGTIADGSSTTALTLTGTGTLYLTGTNTYTGGTTVTGDAELIVTNNEALADGSSLIVGSASAFGGVLPAAAGDGRPAASPAAAPVPEPGTLALLMVGAALLAMYRRRRWCANPDRTGFGR